LDSDSPYEFVALQEELGEAKDRIEELEQALQDLTEQNADLCRARDAVASLLRQAYVLVQRE